MSELSVRETAARAAGAVLWNVSNYPERTQAAMLGQDTGPLRDKVTDAVLAAVADHDGLAVLLLQAGFYPADVPAIRDVVRAWLRDPS